MSHAILSGAKETGVSIVEVSRDRSARISDSMKMWLKCRDHGEGGVGGA